MRCPSCGAIIKKRSMKCPECGAFRNKNWVDAKETEVGPAIKVAAASEVVAAAPIIRSHVVRSTPSLIEFPGLNKTSLPQWRKELGERVREVQERKARESTLEADPSEFTEVSDQVKPTAALELLPQAEVEPMNPIVVAALQRIERAHTHAQFVGNNAMAPAYDELPEHSLEVGRIELEEENKVNDTPPERVHNLAVVPPLEPQPDEPIETVKPKRLIRDDNDPALNYLDKIQTAFDVDVRKHQSAPVLSRIGSALIDLIVVSLLTSPALALTRLGALEWQDPRVIAFTAGVFVVMGFIYLTAITALSGQTLGMRLFSLRVVDARTGLIPTGTQSAGRALVYLLSLASAGIALMYLFIDRERRTAHDRCTRTAVVRV